MDRICRASVQMASIIGHKEHYDVDDYYVIIYSIN